MALRWPAILAVFPATTEAFKSMENSTVGNLDPRRIICPVLSSLYNSGHLKVDSFGIAERAQIKSALKNGIGASEDFAEFQAAGISDYDWTHKHDQNYRDRCAPLTARGAACEIKALAHHDQDKDVKRYLNIFEMNGLETVEHGFSTGTRGGNCNGRLENDPCNGQYPCEPLFQKFYAAHADSRGRLYLKNILEIVCHANAEGDRSGEFAMTSGEGHIPFITVKIPLRQWQMKAAMQGWLSAFGQPDEDGELYLTVDDAHTMMMKGRFPDGWKSRRWGCLARHGGFCPTMPNGKPDTAFLDQVLAHMPCAQFDNPWWGGNETTVTGQSCKSDSSCSDKHALCLNSRCTCGKGRNGLSMLYQQNPTSSSSCQEQKNPRKYFGETCRYQPANNPDSPTTWPSSIVV